MHVEQTTKENATDTRLPHQQWMGLNLDRVFASAFICRQRLSCKTSLAWQSKHCPKVVGIEKRVRFLTTSNHVNCSFEVFACLCGHPYEALYRFSFEISSYSRRGYNLDENLFLYIYSVFQSTCTCWGTQLLSNIILLLSKKKSTHRIHLDWIAVN
jgi:hypothetical protein